MTVTDGLSDIMFSRRKYTTLNRVSRVKSIEARFTDLHLDANPEARCLFSKCEIPFRRNRSDQQIHRRILASHCIPICWIRRNIKRGTRSSCPIGRPCRLTDTPGNSKGSYLSVLLPLIPSFASCSSPRRRGWWTRASMCMCICIFVCVCMCVQQFIGYLTGWLSVIANRRSLGLIRLHANHWLDPIDYG